MNLILAIISGLLTAVSFPTAFGNFILPNFGFLAWVSLVPLFYAVYKAAPRRAFLLTFITAVIYYGFSLYWLYHAMTAFGGLSGIVSVLVLALLIIVESSYSALAVMLGAFVEKRGFNRLVTIPIFWAALEFARNYTPCNGFPWGSLTNSQYEYLPLIQCVDIVGIYGLVYIMIAVNIGVAALLNGRSRYFIYALLLMIVSAGYGVWRINDIEKAGLQQPSRRIALLQANIPQSLKYMPGEEEFQVSQYEKMIAKLDTANTNLIVLAESAYPYVIPKNAGSISLSHNKKILMGALTKADGLLYNSAVLIDGGGNILSRYHKMHLVPFGEYVPYKKLLFFAKKLVAPVGDFAAGKNASPLDVDGWKIGALICYEDIFPEISRKLVRNGANLLATITNDAWYGYSSAPYQHLAISVFRSIETRKAQVRAANSGISAVVDATGRILTRSQIFTEAILATSVKLSGIETVYVKWGDFFAWACVLAAVMLIIKRRR